MDETGERIREAVVEYAQRNPDALDEEEIAPIRNGETFRDQDGAVRIGSWLLEERDGDPVLTRQLGCDTPTRLRILYLDCDAGDWQVIGVDEERLRL